MLRRIICLLCAALVAVYAFPAVSDTADGGNSSYDFDLAFYLNADSFPELLRTRAVGYAALLNRLGVRGNVSWSPQTESMDLEAVVYFTNGPSLTYPFRIYGTKQRVFITSPMINNEIILLNMAALMEFAIKAKNTLGISLPYVALLFPYTTESAFDGLLSSWQQVIGHFSADGTVSPEQFRELSGLWSEELMSNSLLQYWISGVADGSDAPEAVEAEMNSLPLYYEIVTDNKPVSVSVAPESEIWKNAAGNTLFSRVESDDSLSVNFSLPASENGYMPSFSFSRRSDGNMFIFDAAASIRRDPSVLSSEDGRDSEYVDGFYDEGEAEGGWDVAPYEVP